MNINQIDEKDENFMIFKLEDLDLKDLDLIDNSKYIYQENNIENNFLDLFYNNNKDLVFKLPKPIDSSKRKIYILSEYEKKNKKSKLHHC